ncbi:MAG: hypothetical protein KZQ89_07165 [Candidatus Thiodiazotropha sp. (ex Lucinoma kastoroae)]|nr:hypothetical protein [Candidatus Thiodiazotropha sp. (ex Lucinoma kastoroae)]MCU7861052.1 hypothetical protein [Candidatus Thiodiazotropha sp. (ex Lucinoma kastoroae)]
MKKRAGVIVMAMLVAGVGQADQAIQAHIEEGKGVIKAFFGDLKGELVKGMKQNGPVSTIATCNTVAPSLAEAHTQMSGW